MSNPSFDNKALRAAVTVAVVLVALLFLASVLPASDGELRLKYLQFYAELLKTLVAGVVVALLVVLIPHSLNEAKYRFERLRSSRRAYSQAHTGITYLPYRLAVLDYGDAIALIEKVHVRKHMAETYDELQAHLQRKNWKVEDWSEDLAGTLTTLRNEVGNEHDRWASESPEERLGRMLSSLSKKRK